MGLDNHEFEQIEGLIAARKRVKRQQHLYHAGDPFEAIYAIRIGFFKTDILTEDGRDQVTGFQMAGEILGLDGISIDRHVCNAVALEDSDVCMIPFDRLEDLSRKVEPLQRQFNKFMSREIVREQSIMMLLGSMRAEERLAAFLLNLSQRMQSRGYSASEFNLRMTREEIGSYLGLKLETVSRAFSKFQDEGLLTVHQKHIQILDPDALRTLVGRAHV
ncbi:MAG: fumarate/nitrate reduction transcriptional regulator Fnr [Betaproteobacteria bacterium]|nr:fumarate/nitrate reduction transcriptional regulator Fnr [Betaproteobacteria bacterium]